MVEADVDARLVAIVFVGDVVVVRSVDDAADGAMVEIAEAGKLVRQAVGHIAPYYAVVVFVEQAGTAM